ncbi:hypothetical protein [Leucobacter iarius]|uniref:CRISPR type III-B/RAMP module-associated protein Cmr5 n=1 Tax=Leucobacter iarius TaxID=333963 RepID=A0ABP4XSR0_9MICO
MTDHMTPDQQTAVFTENLEGLTSRDDAEFTKAATAIIKTATNRATGYSLATGLVGAMHAYMTLIVNAGQIPVTATRAPSNKAEKERLERALAFILAVNTDGGPAEFIKLEEAPDAALEYMYVLLADNIRQLAHQADQAETDKDATA